MIDYFMTNEALLQYVGKQMQQMRINARLSQQQLAERAGVSRSTITQVENGRGMKIAYRSILKLMDMLEEGDELEDIVFDNGLFKRTVNILSL